MGQITVIAGVNGAGKSSVAGALIRTNEGSYFNPDEHARKLMEIDPSLGLTEANSEAWNTGQTLLKLAIRQKKAFTFETTLGGRSVQSTLLEAIRTGCQVRVFFVGLATVDLHIQRVADRVQRGGHQIPTDKIHERFRKSRLNLIQLIEEGLFELVVIDNSASLDANGDPSPKKLIQLKNGESTLAAPMPDWAQSIAATVLSQSQFKGFN